MQSVKRTDADLFNLINHILSYYSTTEFLQNFATYVNFQAEVASRVKTQLVGIHSRNLDSVCKVEESFRYVRFSIVSFILIAYCALPPS